VVLELAVLFRESLGGRAYFVRAASHFRWEYRAAVEMDANAVGQVVTAPRAQVRVAEQARQKFVLPEALSARHAFSCDVVPAILVEKRTLREAESPRSTAVKVDHAATVAFDSVVGREHLPASRTGRLRRHPTLPAGAG